MTAIQFNIISKVLVNVVISLKFLRMLNNLIFLVILFLIFMRLYLNYFNLRRSQFDFNRCFNMFIEEG